MNILHINEVTDLDMQISLLNFNLTKSISVFRPTSVTEPTLIYAINPTTSFVTFVTFKVKPRSNFDMGLHWPPLMPYDLDMATATF